MLAPMKFPSYQRFLNEWVDYYLQGPRYVEGGIRKPEKFKEYIKDIAIRREIHEVSVQMPDVTRNLLYHELGTIEQNEYDDEVSDFVKWYNDKVIGGEEDDALVGQNILAKMARMRHITGLAKIPATVEFVKTHIEEAQRKICVFTHHIDVADIMTDELKKELPNIPVFNLTSSMDSFKRNLIVDEFNNTPLCVMVASTLSSGESLNLQTCSDGVLHERQWNPQNEDQAAPGRFRRIGAKALELGINVTVTCTTASGTVDEHLAGIVERKRGDFHRAMNKGELPVWNQTALAKELAEAIVKDYNKKKKIDSLTKIKIG
jgi:SNF2 family DNA or RNA helicase